MRAEESVLELLSHPDGAVREQGVELARSSPARRRLALIAALLERDDPWLCLALATTEPEPHARSFMAWCARSTVPRCVALGADRALLESVLEAVEADPMVVFGPEYIAAVADAMPERTLELQEALTCLSCVLLGEVRQGAGRAAAAAARTAHAAALAAAEESAEAVRDGILARSRDPQVAENLYEETRRDSRLRIEAAGQEARLLQRTELYRRCEGLIR